MEEHIEAALMAAGAQIHEKNREIYRLRAALRKIAMEEWEKGCGSCHPEGCECPKIAIDALK